MASICRCEKSSDVGIGSLTAGFNSTFNCGARREPTCLTATHVGLDLDVASYDLLRELCPTRCVLFVLVLPDEPALWLNQSTEELIIRRCAYWYSLRGAGPITARSSIRIPIP